MRKMLMFCLLFFGFTVMAREHKDACEQFMQAVSSGDLQAVHILLDQGCDINIQNDEGRNALMVAIDNRQFEIIQLLIDQNINKFSGIKID